MTIQAANAQNANHIMLDELLVIDDSMRIYDINSAPQASGFFPCPDGFDDYILPSVEELRFLAESSTTRPKFKKHARQCMYISLRNQTNVDAWRLHVSHFFIESVAFSLRSESDTLTPIDKQNQLDGDQSLNILGRSFQIRLLEDKNYFLLLEISADRIGRPPYIGLMSEEVYKDWSADMDSLYKVMQGVVLGLISVALICSIVLRDSTFFWFGTSSLCLFSLSFLRSHIIVDFFKNAHDYSIWLWLLVTLTNLSLLMFARSFMSVGSRNDNLLKFFDIAIVFCAITLGVSFFLSPFLSSILYGVNGVVSIFVISYVACIKLIKEGRYYIIFMLGWLPVLLSIAESIFIMFSVPERETSTLSYKNFREPALQIAHMLIHMVAMFIRVLDLKKQKYLADIKNEAKSRFLASVSHDLRQPLHSMDMFLSHLSDHIKTVEGRNIFRKVYNLHASMNDSFKSLMDLSRLEAGAVSVNKEYFDIEKFVKNIAAEYEPYAQAKDVSLRVRVVKCRVYTDPVLFGRILRNLISNAIKYTEKGGVLCSVRVRKDGLLVQVWDTGCGISDLDQELIFDIYKRSENSRRRETGMGIGLSIVKHLADVLDCSMSLRSKKKLGSMFQLILPIDEGMESLKFSQSEQNRQSSVVVVMDSLEYDFSQTLKNKLEVWDYRVFQSNSISGNQDKYAKQRDTHSRHLDSELSGNTITLVLSTYDAPISESSHFEPLDTYSALVERSDYFKKKYNKVIFGVFCTDLDKTCSDRLKALDIHLLKIPFYPAQLRSLLRHIEVS